MRTRTCPLLALGSAAAVVAALASPPAWAAPPGPLSDVVVDVAEDAAPIRDVLRRLEERHGLNYVASDEVLDRAGLVSVHLRRVPLDVALDAICAACGLVLEPRGAIVIIKAAPEGGAPAPLPRVEGGLAPRDDGRPRLPSPDPPPGRLEPVEDLQTSGRLVDLDLERKRLTLSIDGTRVEFVVRGAGGDPAQAARLSGALTSLRKNSRVALLYRRVGDENVITGIIGRTERRRPAAPAPAGMPRGDVAAPSSLTVADASSTTPVLGAPPAADPGEEEPRAEVPRRLAPAPAGPDVTIPEGALAGRLAGREGEAVSVRLASGEVVDLSLPPADATDRRARILAALETLRAGDRLMVTFDTQPDGRRVITNTITESR